MSDDYEISQDLIRRGRRVFTTNGRFGKRKELSEKEIYRLKKVLKEITEEQDILSKKST